MVFGTGMDENKSMQACTKMTSICVNLPLLSLLKMHHNCPKRLNCSMNLLLLRKDPPQAPPYPAKNSGTRRGFSVIIGIATKKWTVS